MKRLLFVLTFIHSILIYAKAESTSIDKVYITDTIILIDTTYVIDTIDIRKIDNTELSGDTITLDSLSQRFTLMEDEIVKDVFVRQDSGKVQISGKVVFSNQRKTNDWKGYSINSIPPIVFQTEYYHNNLFSYGGQILYSRCKFTNDTLSTTFFKDNTFGIAALGTFHYGSWLQDITHNWFKFGYLDLYLSMAARVDFHCEVDAGVWNETLGQYEADVVNKETNTKFMLRPIFGFRYYITDQFSINIEVGKGNMGMLSSSVSWIIPYPKYLKSLVQ